MNALIYSYDPYTQTDEETSAAREIPCYRVFPDGRPDEFVAETNESLSEEEQERYARLFASSPELLGALEYFYNIMHDYESSRTKGYMDVALRRAREAIAKANGGDL